MYSKSWNPLNYSLGYWTETEMMTSLVLWKIIGKRSCWCSLDYVPVPGLALRGSGLRSCENTSLLWKSYGWSEKGPWREERTGPREEGGTRQAKLLASTPHFNGFHWKWWHEASVVPNPSYSLESLFYFLSTCFTSLPLSPGPWFGIQFSHSFGQSLFFLPNKNAPTRFQGWFLFLCALLCILLTFLSFSLISNFFLSSGSGPSLSDPQGTSPLPCLSIKLLSHPSFPPHQ